MYQQCPQILSFLFLFGCTFAFNPSIYLNSSTLDDNYRIFWTQERDQISLALEVSTTGWVGFGIGEPTSGSMPGADMLIAYVSDDDGAVKLQDSYALGKALPQPDSCQDWKLVAGEQTSDGKTIIQVTRALRTGDKQDRDIVAGQNRILWAFGDTDVVQYHSLNRQARAFTFFGEDNSHITNTSAFTVSYGFSQSVPTTTTTYMCKAFELPVTPELHIIKIVASITSPLVHHAVIHGCVSNSSWVQTHINSSLECFTDNSNIPSECTDVLWAWTPGMESIELPSEAGFKVSQLASDGYKYLLVQTHYSNPTHVQTTDSSQYLITFTSKLRPYNAGVLQLGDPHVTATSIPPHVSEVHYEFSCSPACTSKFPWDLNVFADFLHMHQIGARMYSTHWRGALEIGVINSIDFWDFEFQQTTLLTWEIKAGDRINLHCVYDSSSKINSTSFGLGTDQEMCVDFIFYYPKIPQFDVCGYVRDRTSNMNSTLCGPFNRDVGENVIDERNPVVSDGLLPVTFGTAGVCNQDQSSHVEIVNKVGVGAMVGICLLSVVIIVGMIGGLLFIALRAKDGGPRHMQLQEETEH